jgi:uncharacterized membrane protein YjfL (UPF0719 family)
VLYRQTYPLEHLLEDRSPDGEEVGKLLLQLWNEREVALINPPSAFLLQSKAVQALIWGLHEERNQFFTEEEHSWISQHFLPTYLDEEYFLTKKETYVQKPAFGREGDTVVIKNEEGNPIFADLQQTYVDETPVYQQYVSLPEAMVKTVKGYENVRLLHTCFLINGEAMGIGLRAGGIITNILLFAGDDRRERMKMMSYIINFFIYTVLGFVLMGVGIGLFSLTTKFSERELIRQGNIAVALKLWGKGIGLAIVIYAAWSNSVSLLDAVMWGAIGIITQILAYLALEYIFTPKTNLAKKVEEGNLAVGFSLFAISVIVGLIVAGSMSY